MTKSKYVCANCGVSVYTWASQNAVEGYIWKHATGGRGPTACKSPAPITREVYAEDLNRTFSAMFPWRQSSS